MMYLAYMIQVTIKVYDTVYVHQRYKRYKIPKNSFQYISQKKTNIRARRLEKFDFINHYPRMRQMVQSERAFK